MDQILLFLIALVIVIVLFVLLVLLRKAKIHETSIKEEFIGICASALESKSKKDDRKEKILGLLKKDSEASNEDMRKAFGISARSVVRYMNELEREGKVEQIGKTGQSVIYHLR